MNENFSSIFENYRLKLSNNQEKEEVYRATHNKRWESVFKIIELSVHIADELAESAEDEFAKSHSEKNPVMTHLLFLFHAKVCLTTREVLALLRSGFSDAAIKRWRDSYVSIIIMEFIANNGEECAISFTEHMHIHMRKMLKIFQESKPPAYSWRKPSADEENGILFEFDRVVSERGSSFKSNYGWAKKFLDSKTRPSFQALEELSQVKTFALTYKFSSILLHTTYLGFHMQLGKPLDCGHENCVKVYGPTSRGVEMPSHAMLITLLHATSFINMAFLLKVNLVKLQHMISLEKELKSLLAKD